MTELKTLKDLDVGLVSERVIIERMRQEAIKWIKAYIKDVFEYTKSDKKHDKLYSMVQNGKIDFIMYFFNITKEELE